MLNKIMSTNTKELLIEELKEKIETIQEQDFPFMEVGTGDEQIESYKDCLEHEDIDDRLFSLQDCLSDHQGIVEQNSYTDYIN